MNESNIKPEQVGDVCERCGGAATHTGYAFPAGGSFPVSGCWTCVEWLAETMEVSVTPIRGAEAGDGFTHADIAADMAARWDDGGDDA